MRDRILLGDRIISCKLEIIFENKQGNLEQYASKDNNNLFFTCIWYRNVSNVSQHIVNYECHLWTCEFLSSFACNFSAFYVKMFLFKWLGSSTMLL